MLNGLGSIDIQKKPVTNFFSDYEVTKNELDSKETFYNRMVGLFLVTSKMYDSRVKRLILSTGFFIRVEWHSQTICTTELALMSACQPYKA